MPTSNFIMTVKTACKSRKESRFVSSFRGAALSFRMKFFTIGDISQCSRFKAHRRRKRYILATTYVGRPMSTSILGTIFAPIFWWASDKTKSIALISRHGGSLFILVLCALLHVKQHHVVGLDRSSRRYRICYIFRCVASYSQRFLHRHSSGAILPMKIRISPRRDFNSKAMRLQLGIDSICGHRPPPSSS